MLPPPPKQEALVLVTLSIAKEPAPLMLYGWLPDRHKFLSTHHTSPLPDATACAPPVTTHVSPLEVVALYGDVPPEHVTVNVPDALHVAFV